MRRLLIQVVLPTAMVLAPVLAAAVVALSIPESAMRYFLEHIGKMDALILGLGTFLFMAQLPLCWRALHWRGTGFDEGADRWVNHLAQAAEWFPLLGLLGTVGGILQTFSAITGPIQPHVIIEKYTPAITATGAGLFMAFINILPLWMVILGRDLIVALGGGRATTTGGAMIVMPRRSVTRFFIPLIDVLLLLFVIFLLMPIANLEELEERRQTAVDLSDTVDALERELQRRTAELHQLEEARVAADELQRLREEVERLRQAVRDSLQQRAAFHVVDIDGKTGELLYYDATRAQEPFVRLTDEKIVAALIAKHQEETKGKELYYFFLFPRPETGFPTRAQERRYQAWFGKVAHSLRETP